VGSTPRGLAKRHLRSRADPRAGKDVTRDRPTRPASKDRAKGPLPQNEIVRVRSQPQGPIRERRASTASETERQQRCVLHFSSKAAKIICR
jgi:hypothetical protein